MEISRKSISLLPGLSAQAADKADAIVANALKQAEEIGNGAIYYTTDMLDMAEKVIASAYEGATSNANALEAALRNYLETIRQNKAELLASNAPEENTRQMNMPPKLDEGP